MAEVSGALWEALGGSLGGSGKLWEALGSSGGALGGSGGYAINFHCENLMFFAKVPLKLQFYGVFLTLRFILTDKTHGFQLAGSSPAAPRFRHRLQGPFINTVRTPTVGTVWGIIPA